MTRVPDWSEQEFENRSFKLAALIRRAWRAVARLVAGQLESKPIVTAADAGGIPDAWNMETEAELLGFITDTYLDAAGTVRAAVDAPDDFLLTDDLVAAYLRAARNRLRHIGDEVWQVVSAQLIEGVSAGESIPELAMRVKSTTGVSDARSLTIARTEVHAAHEAGSYDQALFVDPDATKIWLATEDVRTRETHRVADGQRRRLNEPFEVGGGQLRYPGDPLGPADEIINCRCTTVYDFGTLDSVTSDDPELALVAATKKKWTPSKHPRGSDGRFIKKGAVVDFLAKPKPDIPSLSKAVNELTVGSWKKLTEAQRDYIQDNVDKLPKGTDIHNKFSQKLAELDIELGLVDAAEKKLATDKAAPAVETSEPKPEPVKAKVLAQAAPKTNKAAKTIAETDDFAQLGNQKYKKPLGKTGKPLRVGFLGDDGSITAHVGSKPGDPAKVSTFLIWGKYPLGTTVLESADGKQSVVWNGKKFDFRTDGQTTKTLGKQDAYDALHSQTGWVVPKYEGQPVDQPGVLTELVEGYQEPDDEVDTDLPGPAPTPEPTPAPEPELEAPAEPTIPDELATPPAATPQAVSETGPDVLPEPDVLQQLMDDVPLASPATHALFKLKSDQSLTTAEAVQLVQGMSQDDWNSLTADQRTKLSLRVDSALDNEQIDSQESWAAFNKVTEFQAAQISPPAAPSPAMAVTAPETPDLPPAPAVPEPESEPATPGVITDEGEWVAIAAYDFFEGGQTVAETTDGEFKLVKGHTANTWQLKDYQDQTITSFTNADVEAGQAQAETPFHEWKAVPMPEPPSPFDDEGTTVVDFEAEANEISGETDWEMLLDDVGDVNTPTVVAKSAGGGYQLVKDPGGELSIEWNVDGKWIDVETFTPAGLADNDQTYSEVMTSHAGTWTKVAPHPATPAVPEAVTPADVTNSQDLAQSELVYLSQLKLPAGTLVATNNDGTVRILATGDEATPFKSEYFQPSTQTWGEGFGLIPADLTSNLADTAWNVPNDLLTQDAPSPTPTSPSLPDVNSGSLSNQEIASLLAQPHPAGTVIAMSDDGDLRVLANGDGTFSTEFVSTSGGWELLSKNYSQANIQKSLATGNWTIPGDLVPSDAGSATPTLTLPENGTWTMSGSKSFEELEKFTAFDYPAGTIMGISANGDLMLVAKGDGTHVLQMHNDSSGWFDGATLPAPEAAQMLSNNAWSLPDETFVQAVPALPNLEAIQAVDWPDGTVFQTTYSMTSSDLEAYANFKQPAGRIVAQRNVQGVNVRVVATGLDNPTYKQQAQSTSTNVWYDANLPPFTNDEFRHELMSNGWVLPKPAIATALGSSETVLPKPAGTAWIPMVSKKAWKKKLSAAKVGYYSKPEKIWDQIKEIQDSYPDPDNPGNSKLTPLQIIQALDDVYSGKLNSPYESKMVQWAATPKGKAYTGNVGGTQVSTLNTPAVTQTQAPAAPQTMPKTPENISKLYGALGSMPEGTVLATNAGADGKQYQIVVVNAVGGKVPQLQYKNSPTDNWNESVTFPSEQGLAGALDIEFDNTGWQLAVIQLPTSGVPSVTSPVAPLPPTGKPISKTMTSATAVWSKISNMPDDTVLATNEGGLNQYRMVVKSDPTGTKYVQIQRKVKSDKNAPWIDAVDVIDVVAFHDGLNDVMGVNEWELFDPLGSVPAATPVAPAGPPPPKKFKASVKSIYDAMPTLKPGTVMANGEHGGKKYMLVVGYGPTPSGGLSKKKKLLLKTQTSSGYWALVQPLGTQVKLGSVIKDPKYGWTEAEMSVPVAPPSVSNPVKVSKATSTNSFTNTPEDMSSLWDSLDQIGDGVVLANGQPGGVPTSIKSNVVDGQLYITAHTQTGEAVFADSKQQFIDKMVNDPSWKISASKSPLFGAGDIADLSEGKKQDLYSKFKGQPSTYLDSPTGDIYSALSYIAGENGVTLLQMLRVIDDVGAKKVNKPDEHLFEKKIKNWLKTAQGTAVALGKPVPLPDSPTFLPSVDPKKITPFAKSDKLSYKVISVEKAKELNDKFKAASPAGKWDAAQEDGIRVYTGGTYIPINNYYRGKTDNISAANAKAAQQTQEAMRPSTVPMLLHRGVGYDGVAGSNSHSDIEKKVGQTWQAGGFFSTSVGGSAAFGGPVLIELEAPPGTPMAFVDSPADAGSDDCLSSNCGEREMLVGAGLHYKIISVKYQNGKSVVRMRVVPAPDEDEEEE